MSDKYTLIAAEYAANMAAQAADAPALTKMCLWIGVSKSGYYEWKDRPLSATAERQEYLKGKIKEIFDDSGETYGYRRVHAGLARQGEQATSELVRRLMRDLGLVPCQVRKPKSLTTQAVDIAKYPDRVKRDFTAAAPYLKLISDITEIRTWQGKVYLATVIDCFSKEVIGVGDGRPSHPADNRRDEDGCEEPSPRRELYRTFRPRKQLYVPRLCGIAR